jgi:hypothetical protein
MQDYLARLEKLRRDAAECKLISDRATDSAKREVFADLAFHLTKLELAMFEAGKRRSK